MLVGLGPTLLLALGHGARRRDGEGERTPTNTNTKATTVKRGPCRSLILPSDELVKIPLSLQSMQSVGFGRKRGAKSLEKGVEEWSVNAKHTVATVGQ